LNSILKNTKYFSKILRRIETSPPNSVAYSGAEGSTKLTFSSRDSSETSIPTKTSFKIGLPKKTNPL